MAKKKYITINKVKYPIREFDFNLVCELESNGVSIEDIGEKPMSAVRAYAGACMGKDIDYAGKEIGNHVANGGNFNEILEVIGYELENSDFFRSINQTEETED